MDLNKIRRNFRVIGEALIDSGKELITPRTTEEKLSEAMKEIETNPSLTKEEVIEILNGISKKSLYEYTLEELKSMLDSGYERLKDEAIPEVLRFKEKILSLSSKEEIIEFLKLEEILSKANEESVKIKKRVKHVLRSFIEDID